MFGRLGMSTLDFPATEYADVTTTVHVRFDEQGKADHVWFDLPYGSHPTAAAEILDAATAKWLDDAPASDPSVGDAPAEYTFSEDPAILMHTTMERTWQVHIQVREDAEPQSPKKARKRWSIRPCVLGGAPWVAGTLAADPASRDRCDSPRYFSVRCESDGLRGDSAQAAEGAGAVGGGSRLERRLERDREGAPRPGRQAFGVSKRGETVIRLSW